MRLVRLTTCADGFEARILAAKLGSEGIVWSLRGAHDGPLALGAVDVLVDAESLDTAREVLELDDAPAPEHEPAHETTARDVLLAVAVLVGLLLFALVRMAARV